MMKSIRHDGFTERPNPHCSGRGVLLTPDGFWADAVNVHQHRSILTPGVWDEPEVSWHIGGAEGDMPHLDRVRNFAKALNYAIAIAEQWGVETGMPIREGKA